MSASITLKAHVESAINFIEDNFIEETSFFFTSRSIPWDDETSPPVSISSVEDLNYTNRHKLYCKQIDETTSILAVKRVEWATGIIYTQVAFDVEYYDYIQWTHPKQSYYILNSEGNVYKCISNNYGVASTQEPTGQSYTYIATADGYVWKFMYDLTTAISDKFLSEMWLPVPHRDADKSTAHLACEAAAVAGDISFIRVDEGGVGYTSPPTVNVIGDGTGCTATAVVVSGVVTGVTINTHGSDYSYASIILEGAGSGASFTCMVSPREGHSAQAAYELGASFVEVSMELVDDESGIYPVFNSYRTIGIVKNVKDTAGELILPVNTDKNFNAISVINITDTSGAGFVQNEILKGEDSAATAIIYYAPVGINIDVNVYNIEGTFIDNENVFGQDTATYGDYNLAGSTLRDVDIHSGDILYKENIIFIARKEIQTETFIFTIEF